jgi:hypothetical protein
MCVRYVRKHHRRKKRFKKIIVIRNNKEQYCTCCNLRQYASYTAYLFKDNDVEMTDVGGGGSGASSPGIGLAGETKFV